MTRHYSTRSFFRQVPNALLVHPDGLCQQQGPVRTSSRQIQHESHQDRRERWRAQRRAPLRSNFIALINHWGTPKWLGLGDSADLISTSRRVVQTTPLQR